MQLNDRHRQQTKTKSVLRRIVNSRGSQKSQFKPLFRDLKIQCLSLYGRHRLRESNLNEKEWGVGGVTECCNRAS